MKNHVVDYWLECVHALLVDAVDKWLRGVAGAQRTTDGVHACKSCNDDALKSARAVGKSLIEGWKDGKQ